MKNNSLINLQYSTIKTPLPNFIHQDLKTFSQNANLYQPQPQELINKLAQKHQLPQEMFFLTAGIDEALQMFAIAHGQNGFIFTPTYTVHADIKEFGGHLNQIKVISKNKYQVPTQKIPKATLIFLANPNNPSGFTSVQDVIKLVKNNRHCPVVIDEAYAEFADLSVIKHVPKNKNLVVLRSFSKAYSMAGNRLGYITAHPKLIESVKNKTQWSNISYLSVGAALSALNHPSYFAKIRTDINQNRQNFTKFLKKLKFNVFPSHINAVLLKFNSPSSATTFVKFLNQNNIIVSHGNGSSNVGLNKSFVRIAIGTRIQMDELKKIITLFPNLQK